MTYPALTSAPLTIGRFRVQGTLSCGTSHVLYQAIDTHSGAPVAVKCGLPGMEQRNIEPSLKGEWEAAKKLTHPGIQRILEMAHEDGIGTYLVLESLEGRSLASLIAHGIPTIQGLHLLVQLVHVLEASERDGLFHGDLRPENLWISPTGTLRVLGFGSAAWLEPSSSQGPADGSSHLDSDRLRGGPPSADSELIAFALTAYQVLAGQLPSARNPAWVDGVLQFPADMPRAMQRVFSKALDRQPENHYTSLHGFISVLIAASPLDEEQLESLLAFMDGAPVPIDATGLLHAGAVAPRKPLTPRDTQPIPLPVPLKDPDPEVKDLLAHENKASVNIAKAHTQIESILSGYPGIQEFAIYGQDGQGDVLETTSHPGGKAASLAPSFYFQLADAIPTPESKDMIRTITIKSQRQGSIVLFKHDPFSIAILLKPGKTSKGIVEELSALRST